MRGGRRRIREMRVKEGKVVGQFREKEGNNGPGKDDGEDEEVNVRRQQRMGHKIWRGKSRKNQRQKD